MKMLIPLAMVAWADGSIEPKEREAIQRAAAENGIVPGSIAGEVLNKWLTEPLDADLVDTWKRYIQTMWPSLTPHERAEVPQDGHSIARVRSPKRLAASWAPPRVTHLDPGKGSARRPGEAAGRLNASCVGTAVFPASRGCQR